MKQLLDIMRQLRDPESGCPWDLEQNFATIAPYTIEEAYEVADAIAQNDMSGLRSELGDLLFQVVFHAQMASEAELFNFQDVVQGISQKMIERHPHVFQPEAPKLTAAEQTEAWEKAKSLNKDSVLDGIARNLPELLKAVKLTKYAAVTGFDWPNIQDVFDKLAEETEELQEAVQSGQREAMAEELGDLLFVCANLARHMQIDPAAALRGANAKFEQRFREVEKRAKIQHPKKENFDLKVLDELWNQVKAEQKTHEP
ncbi:nucleoside triphosphate pyrophosphohydrolase [Marinicella meishanensis]|uniref:nucleoside triphosphate pyrophosphohydrolase n=1 Tax=Marinicella meishanensis TaxID=2873263 RepID=UPI001CBC8A4A|nr:nucleoside triphosphate pyrophosphohydrolase [Marinicella sp. NBU2979]